MLAVDGPRLVSMRTRDGVRLDADLYRPEGEGPFPVLLVRQAYGRRVAVTICYAHPGWYAAQGYIVVVQDIRGRGTSEGVMKAFENEIADGADTVDWAASLPGSNGRVGMYGFSYQGTDQLLAAVEAGPGLCALAPAMFGWDLREGWAYEGGAFRLASSLGWGAQIGADTARHEGDAEAHAALYQAARSLPLQQPVQARPEVMRRFGHHTHYGDWLDRPADDPYWARVSPATHAQRLAARRLPMLFVGGWYDGLLNGTLTGYHTLARGDWPTKLVVGPWLHFPWSRRQGQLDFGPDAVSAIDRLQVRWFDHWLKDHDTGLMAEPTVSLFDMGANTWRHFEGWPAPSRSFWLGGSGCVSVVPDEGVLLAGEPGADGVDRLVHDPWRPVPSIGGPFGTPAGPVDRASVDARTDVLTFTTAPLQQELSIAGGVRITLHVESDALSFDVCCTVSRVTETGQAFPLTEAYRRIDAHDPMLALMLEPPGTCVTIRPNERLRLSISGASYPAYCVNPGTGGDPTMTPIMRAEVITLGIRYGASFPSSLAFGTTETIVADRS